MRLKYIDILKGLAIFFVVFGHTINPASYMAKVVFSFHMPIFFIIAGYLFNFEKYKSSFNNFFKGKVVRLILPYFMSVILFLLFYLVYQSPKPFIDTPSSAILNIFKSDIIGALYGVGTVNSFNIVPVGPLWFVVCLFCAEVVFYFLLKFTRNWNIFLQYILYFVLSYLGIIVGQKIFLPWSFDVSLVAIFFVFIGFEMKRKNFIEKFSNNKFTNYYLFLLLVVWFILMNNSFISMNERTYNNFVYAYIAAISVSVLLFTLCYKIQNLKYLTFVNKMVSYIGSETMIILLMHNRVISNTPEWSCLRYNDFCFAIYLMLFSLMIGLVIKQIPILNRIYYPNINKNISKDEK